MTRLTFFLRAVGRPMTHHRCLGLLAGLAAATTLGCGRDGILVDPAAAERAAVDSTGTTPTAMPSSHFALTVIALGTRSASDTLDAIPVSGAMVSLTRVATAKGDTVTSDNDAGRAATDASGRAAFVKVPTGFFYLIRSTPPTGSSYRESTLRFAPAPSETNMTVKLWMPPGS